MKTEVVMRRELFGMEISQKSKSEFFSATDLVRAGNKWRASNGLNIFNLSQFMNSSQTKDFLAELEATEGEKCYISGRGRNGGTWVHPLLFIDIALAISPKLKIEVYKWMFDHLIKNRNNSGDSYKKMSGRLYARTNNKRDFSNYISRVAKSIKLKCKVDNWEDANEEQLKKRDLIHYDIALLSDALSNNDEAVRIALTRSE